MTSIPDEQLHSHGDRVKGKVVVITGAASGIGRETALQFAKHGAKIVVGEINEKGAQVVVDTIKKNGGEAVSTRCDVCAWENQINLFELAVSTFGAVDIVIPNAGITELGSFKTVQFQNGRPTKPNLKTLEVNMISVLYTVHLAQHYLTLNHVEGSLKALILLGSVASWVALPDGPIYSAAKHGMLGIMRSLHPGYARDGIRIACIHPFFADTAILPLAVKVSLAGIPMTPLDRIAGAILYSASDTDVDTNGSSWLVSADAPVFMVPKEEFKMGVYKMIDNRSHSIMHVATGISYYYAIGRDMIKIFGKPLIVLALAAAAAKLVWDRRLFH